MQYEIMWALHIRSGGQWRLERNKQIEYSVSNNRHLQVCVLSVDIMSTFLRSDRHCKNIGTESDKRYS